MKRLFFRILTLLALAHPLAAQQIVAPAATTMGATATLTAFTSTLGATVYAIKTSDGNLFGWSAYNAHSAVCYLQLFNTAAASVVLGTTPPVAVIPIGGTQVATYASGGGVRFFSTAISAASTTTATGSTACTAVTPVTFFYK